MSGVKDIPGWVQALIAVVLLIVTATLAYASLGSDIRAEARERQSADELLRQEDQHFREGVAEIKQLLKDEMDRHHPRQDKP